VPSLNPLIIKAISNQKRVDMLNFIQEHHFLNKSDLLKVFNEKRAGLDFHLDILKHAGLIASKEIQINNKKHHFLYPLADLNIDVIPHEISTIISLELPEKISEKDFTQIAADIWTKNYTSSYIQSILETLILKLEMDPYSYFCYVCRKHPGIVLCDSCSQLVCRKCTRKIEKTDTKTTNLCENCISEKFS
jgi:hypothetical protein